MYVSQAKKRGREDTDIISIQTHILSEILPTIGTRRERMKRMSKGSDQIRH